MQILYFVSFEYFLCIILALSSLITSSSAGSPSWTFVKRSIIERELNDGNEESITVPVGEESIKLENNNNEKLVESSSISSHCSEGQFECHHSKECIPMGWLCDGENDCGSKISSTITSSSSSSIEQLDTSDEDHERCQPSSQCPKNYFRCANLITCIRMEMVCDGHHDCPDGSDEAKFCQKDDCNEMKCDFGCRSMPKGAECFCPNGFETKSDPKEQNRCQPINECLYEEQCDQLCLTNSTGNNVQNNKNKSVEIRCDCLEGYQLIKDHKCQAINVPEQFPLLAAVNFDKKIEFFNIKQQNPELEFEVYQTKNHSEFISTFGWSFSDRKICYLKKIPEFNELQLHRFLNFAKSSNQTKKLLQHNKIWCNSWNDDLKIASSETHQINSPFYSTLFVRSLVFEWIGRNWYLLDGINEVIFVCSFDFKHCTSIVDSGLNKPKMLALDSIAGFMFTVEWGPNAFLKRFYLDGTIVKILIQERLVYPSLISLDHANRLVYWYDTYLETLERIKYDGSGRKIILKNHPNRIISIDVFERNLFLLIEKNSSISSNSEVSSSSSSSSSPTLVIMDLFHYYRNFSRQNSDSFPIINLQNGQNESLATDMKIIHRQRQPLSTKSIHPCSINNGGCDQLCFVKYDPIPIARCQCSMGYRFDLKTKTKCLPDDNSLNKLLYVRSRPGSIKLISLPSIEESSALFGMNHLLDLTNKTDYDELYSPPIITISTNPTTRPVAVEFDIENQTIFYSNIQRYVINSFRLDSTNDELRPLSSSVFVDKGVIRCEGLTLDWIGRNLYWTDSAMLAISVASLDNNIRRKTLISMELNHPKSIVLDLRHGYIFWTDWTFNSNSSGRIERSWMNGQHREVLIKENLIYPNGLAIDQEHIYWCDSYFKRLEQSDLNGKNRKLIYDGPNLGNPYSVAYFRQQLFWTDYRQGRIKMLSLDDEEKKIQTILIDSSPLYDLKFIDFDQKMSILNETLVEQCQKCDHLCLLAPKNDNETTVECHCSDGYELNQDHKSCHVLRNYTRPSLCKKGEFECRNISQCIDNRHVCDGDPDCLDGSDEDASIGSICEKINCREDYFRCDKNRCVMPHWVCDGQLDCLDGTDEMQFDNCTKVVCGPMFFKCNITGRCIPRTWVCDSEFDCGQGDYSDEHEQCQYPECDQDTEFRCQNGRCISLRFRCDGDDDCKDQSDERDCHSTRKCQNNTETHFQCDSESKCLPKFLRCNGIVDCIDNSDEMNCLNATTNQSTIHYDHIKQIFAKSCPEHAKNNKTEINFRCQTGIHCIPAQWRCDGSPDCPDYSDEMNCRELNCRPEDFRCEPLMQCFSSKVRCNNMLDCPDGSDETDCDSDKEQNHIQQVVCHHPNRTCIDRFTNQTICLGISKFCDNRPDCLDHSDEGDLCSEDVCFFSSCKSHCHNVPYDPGYVCYCPDGLSLAVDGVSCTDVPPCEQWAVCSQHCVPVSGKKNHQNAYKCECADGYYLDPKDNFTCKSILSASPIVLFSNRNQIRSINLQTNSASLLLSGLKNSIAIDYMYDTDQTYIFWSDVIDDRMYRGELIQSTITNIEAIIEGGLNFAEGLAVDWLAHNIYWVDSNFNQIQVAHMDGTSRKTLLTEHLANPRAIALDPNRMLMFWTDWDSYQPRIECASMDGTARRLVKNVEAFGSWPNGLTLDFILERIYWIDAKTDTLSTVRYNGEDFRNILMGNDYLSHPFAMSMYENFVYWSDWRTNSLVRANKWNGTKVEVIARTFSQPFDVKILHPSRQPRWFPGNETLCMVDNGGCSHLCLLSTTAPSNYSCDCPHAMRLGPDGRNCIYNEEFLMISKQNDVRGLDLDRPSYFILPPITLPHVLHPIQLDYVAKTKHIYWADSQLNEIKRFSLRKRTIENVIDTIIQHPQAFAIDWVAGNIFIISKRGQDFFHSTSMFGSTGSVMDDDTDEYEIIYEDEQDESTSSTTGPRLLRNKRQSPMPMSYYHHHRKANFISKLFVCNLKGEFITELIPENHFENPQSLAVDPLNSYLYWSEYLPEEKQNGTTKYLKHRTILVRSLMNGSNVTVLADSDQYPLLNQSTSLQLDLYHNFTKLYWVNLGSKSIQFMDLETMKIQTLFHNDDTNYTSIDNDLPQNPTSITIHQSKLYAFFHHEGQIHMMDKNLDKISKSSDWKLFHNDTEDLLSIRIYDAEAQNMIKNNLCSENKGGCSHLCMMVNTNQRKCLCTIGYRPDPVDETKCIGEQVFLMYSWNWGIRAIPITPINDTDPLNRQYERKKNASKEFSLLPPISAVMLASSIDFDSANEILYWADSDEGSISRVGRDTSAYHRLMNNVDKLVDFALDWNAYNLYWIEEQFGLIEVMKSNGSESRLVLISEGIVKPTSLAVHPGLGYLIWSDVGQNDTVRIERAWLDGEKRMVIYENAKRHTINDLAVDIISNQLYFADLAEQSIIQLSLIEENPKPHTVLSKIRRPISISVYDRFLYWADTNFYGGSIFAIRTDKFIHNSLEDNSPLTMSPNMTGVTLLDSNIGDNIKDINVYYRRPVYPQNGCARNNGGCEDFCFYQGPKRGHHCACSYGYVSPQDHRSCLEYDTFLIYSRINQIDSVRIPKHQENSTNSFKNDEVKISGLEPNDVNAPYRPIMHSNIRNVIGLTYDYERRRIIYTDVQRGTINWCHFNGSDHRILLDKQGPIEGIVYEPRSKFIYWTSNSDSSVAKLNLSVVPDTPLLPINSSKTRLPAIMNVSEVVKIVKLGSEDRLRGIAIDRCRQMVYWTNWNTKDPSIQRAHISGYGVQSIITDGIRMPNSITIDQRERSFYWADARFNKIERCDLDAVQCVVLLRQTVQHPFDLAIHGSHLYWTDWAAHAVFRCDKHTGMSVTTLRRNIVRPMGLVVVAPNHGEESQEDICTSSPPYDPCLLSNGGCEDICTVKNSTTMNIPHCSCFEGRVLSRDGRRCHSINSTCLIEHGEFECTKSSSSLCIPLELTCDGIPNCGPDDNSDEDPQYCANRSCPTNYFRCVTNNRCIIGTKLCDGVVNCPDASDEKHCDCRQQGKFRCNNGICISDVLRCNYSPECPDGSDEFDCPKPNCTRDEKTNEPMINCLRTTACISPKWICDGQNDCWDNSDEAHCFSNFNKSISHLFQQQQNRKQNSEDKSSTTVDPLSNKNSTTDDSCAEDQIRCGSGECISIIWSCDGNKDCLDGSDETTEFCQENRHCPQDRYFRCKTTGKCIPNQWICDGELDCFDGSDEMMDVNQTSKCPNSSNITSGSPTGTVHRVCNHNEFQCHNHRCIHSKFLCDGVDDCGDGSDEQKEFCQRQQPGGRPKLCSPNEYRCTLKHKCIPRSWICNGIRDCAGGDDESAKLCSRTNGTSSVMNSDGNQGCQHGQFVCNNGVCVDADRTCNGDNDCGDFSDENQCNINECESNLVCAQRCEDMPIGYRCSCFDGFESQDGGRICRDINECEQNVCSQMCRNTIGSFVCYCADGYRLDQDGVTCRSKSHQSAQLLITTHDGIYQLKPMDKQLQRRDVRILLGGLSNAVAVDFDWKENCIYWSEITIVAAFIKKACHLRPRDVPTTTAPMINKTHTLDLGRGDSNEIHVLHSNTLQSPDGIAVDWIGRNLYWCDKGKSTIEVSKLDGKFRRVLIRDPLEEPRAIVLNPLEGIMFWTDWGERPHIGRASMDGSNHRVILEESLGWPNALTLDFIRRRLYFADAREDYIGMIDFEGQNRVVIVDQKTRFTGHIFAMAYFESRLFWTDWHSSSVVACPALNCSFEQFVPQMTFHRPMDVQVWHPDRQPSLTGKNPCQSDSINNIDGCLALCLLRSENNGHNLSSACTCPDNYILNEDHRSCRSNCSYSEFVCHNTYKCIPFWWKCDTQDDCGDGSDEPEDCPPFHCNPGQFQCRQQAECILPQHICDGVANCADSSDEQDCDRHACMPNQFKCSTFNNITAYCISSTNRCDGVNDCPSGEDELNCGCPKTAFKCANKKCISKEWECDGEDDCGDRSDESETCAQKSCGQLHFRCDSGRCIPYNWKCDGEPDCPRGQDELNCEMVGNKSSSLVCDENHFHCDNNRCIQMFYRCDLDDDCGDGSDERNCTIHQCDGKDEFKCDGGFKCIKQHQRCDGHHDCADLTDELDCHGNNQTENSSRICQDEPDKFVCANGLLCIFAEWRCDGDYDCLDGSDEQNCTTGNSTIDSKRRSCSPKDFLCANQQQCINGQWRCDGDQDCSDGSDEDQESCQKLACPLNRFRCTNGICLSKLRLCDGVDHCGDGSDETHDVCEELKHECQNSQEISLAHLNRFQCHQTKKCIDISLRCDGQDDCGDGSDELDCAFDQQQQSQNKSMFHQQRPSSCPFGLCSQTCLVKNKHHHSQNGTLIPHHQRFMCTCSEGYRWLSLLNTTSFSILTESINITQHHQLTTCQANGPQATLLVSSDSGFRMINPYKNDFPETSSSSSSFYQFPSISSNLTLTPSNRISISRIESFDVFYDKNSTQIFWTNPHKNSLYRIDITDIEQLFDSSAERAETIRRFIRSSSSSSSLKAKISEPIAIINGSLESPRGVAVDWIARYVYLIDAGTDGTIETTADVVSEPRIMLVTFDGRLRKTLIEGDPLEQPYDLLVDPKNCLMFWTDWSHTSSVKIARANLDGSSVRPLVQNDLEWPLGLALDFEADRLYYTDPKPSVIESIRLDGTDRRQIYAMNRFQQKPYRMDIWEDYLFVTTLPNHQILKMNKFGHTHKMTVMAQNIAKLNDLVIVQQWRQKRSLINPCLKNPCRTDRNFLCLAQSPENAICTCPDMYKKILNIKNEVECIPSISNSDTNDIKEHNKNKEPDQCQCLNNGKCHYDSNDKLYCECTPLYEGEHCERFRCSGHCHNHALCYLNMSNMTKIRPNQSNDNRGKLQCMCPFGFIGELCETEIESCEQYPNYCLNGGQCRTLTSLDKAGGTSKKIRCDCKIGFFGEQCEICSDRLCKNDGHCSIDGRKSKCFCQPGFSGDLCELHQCSKSYCNDNGQCYVERLNGDDDDDDNGRRTSTTTTESSNGAIRFRCECNPGFSGDLCQVSKMNKSSSSSSSSLCEKQNYCLNGGTCHSIESIDHFCICPNGFNGLRCEHRTIHYYPKINDNSNRQHSERNNNNNNNNLNPTNNKINDDSTTNQGKINSSSSKTSGSSSSSRHYEMMAYTTLIIIAIILFALLVLRLQNSLRKKMQSELAFQHRRIPETSLPLDGPNVEIMNPVFQMNNLAESLSRETATGSSGIGGGDTNSPMIELDSTITSNSIISHTLASLPSSSSSSSTSASVAAAITTIASNGSNVGKKSSSTTSTTTTGTTTKLKDHHRNNNYRNDNNDDDDDDDELIVDYMNTNFSNPIYEYKKMVDKNPEETENLL